MKTAAIIPAFNEAESLPKVITELKTLFPEHSIVVINDGSVDDTEKLAITNGAICLSLPFNLGIGGALRLGFKYCLENDFDCAYQFDADGQHDASQVLKLLSGLENADMVVGSRFAENNHYEVGNGRRAAMGLLRWLIKLLSGQKFTDTSSGFRAFKRPIIELFANEYPVEYMDSVEAIVIAVRNGFKVKEVPTVMNERLTGTPSNRNIRLVYYFLRLLIVLLAGTKKKKELNK